VEFNEKKSKKMEKKVFRSRISLLYILFFGIFIFHGWFIGGKIPITLGIILILCLFVISSMRYVLTDKEIHLYYLWGSILVGTIFISGISSVERSYNPFSALAASVKRLHFRFKKGYKWLTYFSNSPFLIVVFPSISPVREQEFLETLKSLNPNIQINVIDKKGLWWRFWGWDI
jgi:hypothetical protein